MMATSLAPAWPAHALTTFTVNSTADTPDASTAGTACDTDVFTGGDECTLRAAIQQANATAGADAINFNIPGTGVKTVNVGATGFGRLPTITDPVTINGYTQPGSSPNTKAVGNDAVLKIELSGASVQGATGLTITHVSGSSVIKDLVINRFGEGIDIVGDTVGNRIEGNSIGTVPTGTLDRGYTDDGVNITNSASENVVGAPPPPCEMSSAATPATPSSSPGRTTGSRATTWGRTRPAPRASPRAPRLTSSSPPLTPRQPSSAASTGEPTTGAHRPGTSTSSRRAGTLSWLGP
jgi:CSLREA domain-containing protein